MWGFVMLMVMGALYQGEVLALRNAALWNPDYKDDYYGLSPRVDMQKTGDVVFISAGIYFVTGAISAFVLYRNR